MRDGDRHTFWMVYGVGQRAPTYRHPSAHAAEREAIRLAKECPGIEFVVLEAKSGHQVVEPVQSHRYVELPF